MVAGPVSGTAFSIGTALTAISGFSWYWKTGIEDDNGDSGFIVDVDNMDNDSWDLHVDNLKSSIDWKQLFIDDVESTPRVSDTEEDRIDIMDNCTAETVPPVSDAEAADIGIVGIGEHVELIGFNGKVESMNQQHGVVLGWNSTFPGWSVKLQSGKRFLVLEKNLKVVPKPWSMPQEAHLAIMVPLYLIDLMLGSLFLRGMAKLWSRVSGNRGVCDIEIVQDEKMWARLANDKVYIQVPGPAAASVSAEWAWAGSSIWQPDGSRPGYQEGLWEFGPFDLQAAPKIRVTIDGKTRTSNVKDAMKLGQHP